MSRIFFNFFIISLINGRVNAIYPTAFLNPKNNILWGYDVSNKISNGMERNFDNITTQYIAEAFSEIINHSNILGNYANEMDEIEFESFDKVVHKIRDNSLGPIGKPALTKLNSDVEHLFDEAYKIFRNRRQIADKSLENFAKRVLEGSSNLPNTLDNIYQLVVTLNNSSKPGFMELLRRDADLNLPQDCNRYISIQEIGFFFYASLIVNEMRGLATLMYAHTILQRTDKSFNHLHKVSDSKLRFEARIIGYHDEILRVMEHFPRVIHRCEVYPVQRDVDFVEFINYHSIMLLTMKNQLTDDQTSDDNCNVLNHVYAKDSVSRKVYNCSKIDEVEYVEMCPAGSNSQSGYLWWKTAQTIYGREEKCPNKILRYSGYDMKQFSNYLCVCSTIETIPSNRNILRLSTTPQMSDIANNMIVVGVKFVIHDNAIHLQIQQSKFRPHDMDNNFTEWKKLDNHNGNVNKKFYYQTLEEFSGQIYLDDVMLPPKFAVTGVKFVGRSNHPRGFYLEVHGTPLDLYTGKLDSDGSIWIASGDWKFLKTSDYKRKRVEIEMIDPDDPSRCSVYDYDRETNKFIKFRHSSVLKDAGQSTVPYLDAQSVEIHPVFPLSGIGLFYRQKEGCGGYIAPRIFNIDISQYLWK